MQWKAETRAVIFEHRKKNFSQRVLWIIVIATIIIVNKEDPINLNIISLRATVNDHFSQLICVTDANGLCVSEREWEEGKREREKDRSKFTLPILGVQSWMLLNFALFLIILIISTDESKITELIILVL